MPNVSAPTPPVGALSDAELEGAIAALLAKAARCSPPRSIVEAAEQAAVLRQLAHVRDELHRRARSRAGLPTLQGEDRTTSRKIRTRAGIGAPLKEETLDRAMECLARLEWRARENLVEQARDPATARVLLEAWREDLTTQRIPMHAFRKILVECERRDLVQLSGPFVCLAGGRAAYLRAAGAARQALEVAP